MSYNDLLDIPLTVKMPELVKAASYKLSENIDVWDKEIINHIHEDLSFITDCPYEISFKKIDKNFGYAVGVIKFMNLDGVYIPIVIRKYQLSPLDIIVVSGNSMPLNEITFNSIISTKQPLGKLRDSRLLQPYRERQDAQNPDEVNVHPSTKYGCFLNKANGNSSLLKKIAQNNPSYLYLYKNNNTMDILKKAMSLSSVEDKKDIQEKVEGKLLEISTPYTIIEKSGFYKIANSENKFSDGILINNIYDFDLKKQNLNLFVSNEQYGYQEKYAGIKSSKETFPTSTEYGIGDNITFIAKKGNYCIATIPIRVASKTISNMTKISGYLMNGDFVNLYLTPNLKNIVKVAESTYHIPKGKMQIVKLGRFSKFHWNPDIIEKQAIVKVANGSTTRIVRDGTMFSVESNIKTAGTYNPSELYDILKPYYSNAIDMVKTASTREDCLFSGIKPIIKIAKKKISLPFEQENLFKIAAGLTEPDSVDAVLSLNFINENNIEEFVELIPEFENVISKLAKLLLAIRMGLKGDEHSIKQAMTNLQTTVEILKNLK